MTKRSTPLPARLSALVGAAALVITACGSSGADDAADVEPADDGSDTTVEASGDNVGSADTPNSAADTTPVDEADPEAQPDTSSQPAAAAGCDEVAALFVTRGSANPDLEDPAVAAVCDGDSIVITTNAVPDYPYVETSPGSPGGSDSTYTITANPTLADEVTAIPYIGTAGITLSGIPIFGPTEGTGGDVDSIPGIVSECGSHMGPSGFHTHKIVNPADTDCFFAAEEVAESPQLVGYALDGFPIYTGIDQYTSSWELTDESLFASDTWAAHTYVEGSGDLDECNGLTDEDGNYAYYTTEGFPYILGCFVGTVDIADPGSGGGAGGGGDGERPERPEPVDDEAPPADS